MSTSPESTEPAPKKPDVTEVDKLRLSNLQLRLQNVQLQLQMMHTEVQKAVQTRGELVAEMEQVRKDFQERYGFDPLKQPAE